MLAPSHDQPSIFHRDANDLNLGDKIKRVSAFVPASAAGAIAFNSIAVLAVYLVAGKKTSNEFDVLTAAVGAIVTFAFLVFILSRVRKHENH